MVSNIFDLWCLKEKLLAFQQVSKFQRVWKKTVLFGEFSLLILNPIVRQEDRWLSLLCAFTMSLDTPPFCTFNGSDRVMPLTLSKASKTHPKISNTLYLCVATVHIHHTIKTMSLWAKIVRNKLSGRSDTAPHIQWDYAPKTTKIIIFHSVLNVQVIWWLAQTTG